VRVQRTGLDTGLEMKVVGLGPQLFPGSEDSTRPHAEFLRLCASSGVSAGLDVPMSTHQGDPRVDCTSFRAAAALGSLA
jgi:hypothetical protein